MVGPVEDAVRAAHRPPVRLFTAAKGAPFVVKQFDDQGVILLLGRRKAHTRISWKCLEGLPDYLRTRGWVKIGSMYQVDAEPGTLDSFMKECIKRATAPWVAALLEPAGVIEIRRTPPASVQLAPDF